MKELEKLKSAITIIHIKGDLRHRQDHALGMIPIGFSRWYSASSYLFDIERIFLELKMSKSFIENIPDEAFFETHYINPEDYIMYHQGYFLDLVHQMKDKLYQLLYAIVVLEDEYSKKPIDIKTSKLTKNALVKRIKNLFSLIEEWDAYKPENVGPIATALRKRAQYHHYKNPLPAQENYFRVKSHRALLKPDFSLHLSEYGKNLILERKNENFEAWHKDTLKKITSTLSSIEDNIESMAKSIFAYFKLPSNDTKGRSIMIQYIPLEENASINPCTLKSTDADQTFQVLFEMLIGLLESLPDDFVSLYAIGSIIRPKDFMYGISDINFVLVIKSDDPITRRDFESMFDKPRKDFGIPFDIKVFTQDQFMLPENEKVRFICKTDGVLLTGQDLLKNEKNKNKSYHLVWLLNKDYIEKVEEAKKWLSSQTEVGPTIDYEMIARDLAKRSFRLAFGQVIGNNTVYSSSYKAMKNLMEFYTPTNKVFTNRIYILVSNRIHIDKANLIGFIESLEQNIYPLFDAIKKAVKG